MLEHLNPAPRAPQRVVVIGAAGFVGKAVAVRMERDGVALLRVTREQAELTAADAGTRLAGLLRPGDAVVAVAARAPCKDADMLIENMAMVRAMTRALSAAGGCASSTISGAVGRAELGCGRSS